MPITTKSGYTLIEVLITFAILGAVAVPLIMFLSNIIADSSSELLLDSIILGQNTLEEIIATENYANNTKTVLYGGQPYEITCSWTHFESIGQVTVSIKPACMSKNSFTLYWRYYKAQAAN